MYSSVRSRSVSLTGSIHRPVYGPRPVTDQCPDGNWTEESGNQRRQAKKLLPSQGESLLMGARSLHIAMGIESLLNPLRSLYSLFCWDCSCCLPYISDLYLKTHYFQTPIGMLCLCIDQYSETFYWKVTKSLDLYLTDMIIITIIE